MTPLLLPLLFLTSLVHGQWDPAGALFDADGGSVFLNGNGPGSGSGYFGINTNDSLIIPLSLQQYDSITIEWWVFWTRKYLMGGTSPPPRQTMFYYGSETDPNNYIWISPSNGSTPIPNQPLHPNTEVRTKDSTLATDTIAFRAFDDVNAWTHFALSLQPASKGPSVLVGFGKDASGVPYRQTVNVNVKNIGGNPKIFFGTHPQALNNELGNPVTFCGYIGEVRIWNVFRDVAIINSTRFMSINGDEPNLIHLYRFGQSNPTADSTGTTNAVLSGTPIVTAAYNSPAGTSLIPLYIVRRNIAYNGVASISLASTLGSGNSPLMQINTLPSGYVCSSADNPCQPTTSIAPIGPSDNYNILFKTTRGSCGVTTSFTAYIAYINGFGPSNIVQFQITASRFNGTTFSSTITPVSTVGGNVTISGTTLGVDDLWPHPSQRVFKLLSPERLL